MFEIDLQFTHLAFKAQLREIKELFCRALFRQRAIIFGRFTGVSALDIEFDVIIVADRLNLSHYLFKRNERQHLRVHRPTIRRNPISSSWFLQNRWDAKYYPSSKASNPRTDICTLRNYRNYRWRMKRRNNTGREKI